MQDPIIQTKTCAITGKEFSITQGDLDFYAKISPTFAGQKFQIPTPTLCPEERQRRRLAFRNERNLYRRTCDASGKQIISIYKPDSAASDGASKPYKVYDQKIRRSDARDPMEYGREFDFSKTFTENFRELMDMVPRLALLNKDAHNSEYCNHATSCLNSYLIFWSAEAQNSLYWSRILDSDNCIDCYNINHSNNIFSSIDIYHSSNIYYSVDIENCSFCYGCVWLKNSHFCIYNVQYDKDDYIKIISNMKFDISELSLDNYIRKNNFQSDIINSTFVSNSSSVISSKDIYDSKDISYSYDLYNWCIDCKDCYSWYGHAELSYECYWFWVGWYLGISIMNVHPYNNVLYSESCFQNSNLFGCIGLRNKSYCIFNKQYTKDEYETTVAHIIAHMQDTGEWWEFFHPSLSPFGYNETVAQEYYPVTSGNDAINCVKT
jgi:hypothetical protein